MTEEEMIIDKQGLVHYVVKRLNLRQYELEDLLQVGNIGLIKAIRGFDASKGYSFSSYAVNVIRGTILNQLRTGQPVYIPSHVRELIVKIKKEELEDEEPEVIAAKTKAPITRVENALSVIRVNAEKTESLNKTTDDDEGITLVDYILQVDDDATGYIAIKDALNSLPYDLREVIYFRYVKDLNKKETAERIGTYSTAVSRMEKRAIGLLREYLKEEEVG